MAPTIAVISFPGNNCEVESLRAIRNNGMEALFFRWNDDREKLKDIDGYFIPGGFSYEDRGRAGMVAGRDPLLAFIAEEAAQGKVVIGDCNGAQVLVESGLIPLDRGLKMSLARNVIDSEAQGFLNEWLWITPTCARDRCATSDWQGVTHSTSSGSLTDTSAMEDVGHSDRSRRVMHLPIAHGEGRFTTKDPDLIEELKKNDQLAFSYCDAEGNVSTDPIVTPNGSEYAIAGICNPAGNVIALMPHPERTGSGAPYFQSMKKWIEEGRSLGQKIKVQPSQEGDIALLEKKTDNVEIFIDTIITNNEERTVEQAAHRVIPDLKLIQLRYLSLRERDPADVLSTISLFNPNKEVAYIRRGGKVTRWDSDAKKEESLESSPLDRGVLLFRRDEPDTGAVSLGQGSETGICYVCALKDEQKLYTKEALEIFHNPHASTLERLV